MSVLGHKILTYGFLFPFFWLYVHRNSFLKHCQSFVSQICALGFEISIFISAECREKYLYFMHMYANPSVKLFHKLLLLRRPSNTVFTALRHRRRKAGFTNTEHNPRF